MSVTLRCTSSDCVTGWSQYDEGASSAKHTCKRCDASAHYMRNISVLCLTHAQSVVEDWRKHFRALDTMTPAVYAWLKNSRTFRRQISEEVVRCAGVVANGRGGKGVRRNPQSCVRAVEVAFWYHAQFFGTWKQENVNGLEIKRGRVSITLLYIRHIYPRAYIRDIIYTVRFRILTLHSRA